LLLVKNKKIKHLEIFFVVELDAQKKITQACLLLFCGTEASLTQKSESFFYCAQKKCFTENKQQKKTFVFSPN